METKKTNTITNSDTKIPFYKKKGVRITYFIVIHAFAIAGASIIGAWTIYQLGFTNNKGAIDQNNRYLANVATIQVKKEDSQLHKSNVNQFMKLAVLNKFYPKNAQLILEASRYSKQPQSVEQMIAASEVYIQNNKEYKKLSADLNKLLNGQKVTSYENVIPWMNTEEWEALKVAIMKDKDLIDSAAKLTGVESRLIVGCLVGEQIRLFNSKREMYKKYLGPVKVLSVQSQFSLGVNGIKDFTAMQVERNLKNDTSIFYMGKEYENLLDFKTNNPEVERITRLTDYRNHLYSYIYTGCILHQTMLQWKRSGFDIDNRPDILFTLFNVGFPQSKPNPDPKCGGSYITVHDKLYTFGAIGFDFYYSGELSDAFPLEIERFHSNKTAKVKQNKPHEASGIHF